jgi:hypothetical protein
VKGRAQRALEFPHTLGPLALPHPSCDLPASGRAGASAALTKTDADIALHVYTMISVRTRRREGAEKYLVLE